MFAFYLIDHEFGDDFLSSPKEDIGRILFSRS